MGFTLMQHPQLDGATFAAPVGAVDHYKGLGWVLVKPDDIRPTPEAFDLDALAASEPAASGPAADAPTQPARSASKADWVTYAAELGVDRDSAEAMTRDELVTNYAIKES